MVVNKFLYINVFFAQFQGFGIFDAFPRIFNKQFRCYSVALCPGNEREDVEKGGKSMYALMAICFCVFFANHFC